MFELNKKLAILENSKNEIQNRLHKGNQKLSKIPQKNGDKTMKLTHSISMISTNK